MPSANANGYVDLAHHYGIAAAHVASIALDQIGALILSRGKTRGVVEDASVTAVGGVTGDVARALRLRIDLVVHLQVGGCGVQRAKCDALVLGDEGFLECRQAALGPVEESGAIL